MSRHIARHELRSRLVLATLPLAVFDMRDQLVCSWCLHAVEGT